MSEEQGLPTAAEVVQHPSNNGDVPAFTDYGRRNCEKEDELVRREDIVKKMESSIEASKKFRDRYEEGSETWKQYQKAVQEKKALLQFVKGDTE